MKKILLFCILLVTSYSFAQDLDISVGNIEIPKEIFLRQRVKITIELLNNSGKDLESCTLTIEIDDGTSKISEPVTVSKDGQTVELKWVPQRKGKMQFKVTISPPPDSEEKNQENNQVIKVLEVLPPVAARK